MPHGQVMGPVADKQQFVNSDNKLLPVLAAGCKTARSWASADSYRNNENMAGGAKGNRA